MTDLNEAIKARATTLAVESFNMGVMSERERMTNIINGDDTLHHIGFEPQILKVGQELGTPEKFHFANCPGCRLLVAIKGESK